MITINKLERIKQLLEQYAVLESQEKYLHTLAEKAVAGDCKSFDISISGKPIEDKKECKSSGEMADVVMEMIRSDMASGLGLKPIYLPKASKSKEFTLEVGDADLLQFLGLSMTIIAGRKKKIVTALRRLGIKF